MKKYEFKLTINEGNDEFWEGLEGKPGCDELHTLLRSMLWEFGFNYDNSELKLISFRED